MARVRTRVVEIATVLPPDVAARRVAIVPPIHMTPEGDIIPFGHPTFEWDELDAEAEAEASSMSRRWRL